MERHRLDGLSLVFGLLFAAAGLALLGGGPSLVDRLPMAWVGPIAAIGLGVILVVGARPERDSPSVNADEPESPAES
jgi:hypothetical protein